MGCRNSKASMAINPVQFVDPLTSQRSGSNNSSANSCRESDGMAVGVNRGTCNELQQQMFLSMTVQGNADMVAASNTGTQQHEKQIVEVRMTTNEGSTRTTVAISPIKPSKLFHAAMNSDFVDDHPSELPDITYSMRVHEGNTTSSSIPVEATHSPSRNIVPRIMPPILGIHALHMLQAGPLLPTLTRRDQPTTESHDATDNSAVDQKLEYPGRSLPNSLEYVLPSGDQSIQNGRDIALPLSPTLYRGPPMHIAGKVGQVSPVSQRDRIRQPLHVTIPGNGANRVGQGSYFHPVDTQQSFSQHPIRAIGLSNPIKLNDRDPKSSNTDPDDEGDDNDDDLVDADDEVTDWDLGDEAESETVTKPLPSGQSKNSMKGKLHSVPSDEASPTKAANSASPLKPQPLSSSANKGQQLKPNGLLKLRPTFAFNDSDNEIFQSVESDSSDDSDNDNEDIVANETEAVHDWLDMDPDPLLSYEDSAKLAPKSPSRKKNDPMPPSPSIGVGSKRMLPSNPYSPHSPSKIAPASSPHLPTHPPPIRPVTVAPTVQGNMSPTRGHAVIRSSGYTSPAVSPVKPRPYCTNIVTNAAPAVIPMTMIGESISPTLSAHSSPVGNSPIRDTKIVKKKRAELPQHNLPHPTPKFGDWLNSRTMINNYIILKPLGAGSYAEVKLCKEKISGKLFAMKFINRDIMKKDKLGKQSKLDDIKREIAIMKKLNHPNVLRLYEVMDDPTMNKLFLVLEYMKHGDLLSHQRKKQADGHGGGENLHDRDLHCVFLQVILGLAYLHEQNVVHGDIKPQNLLVGDKDIVKIADFGISQSLYGSKQKIVDSAGTPAFMSPEMCSGEEYSGQLADIWAVGATVFMLKFGNPPFVAKSAMQLFEKIQNDPLVFPGPIDPLLEDLLVGMLTKDPQKRLKLLDVMTHPWVSKLDHPLSFFDHHAAPQITVSNDEIEHAIASKDRIAVMINIRIQMMKRLHQARLEVVERRKKMQDTHQDDVVTTPKTLFVGGRSVPNKYPLDGPEHAKCITRHLGKLKTSKVIVGTIDDDKQESSTTCDSEGRSMLSSEEIDYRAQLFSRKKPNGRPLQSPPRREQEDAARSHKLDCPDKHLYAGVEEEEDAPSSDDDEMAVSQSQQLLDELLLTTLSMPPLTKNKSRIKVSDENTGSYKSEALHNHFRTNGTPSTNDAQSFYAKNSELAIQFAVSSLQGRRNTQEDRWVVLPAVNEIPAHIAFAGLYDGHGGEECANILREQLHSWIFHNADDQLLKSETLQHRFIEFDSFVCDYLLQKGDLSGSTATCIIFSPTHNTNNIRVVIAHVGDCRIVLGRKNGETVELTHDHRLMHPEERDRILQLGGRVVNNRVNGVMAITRAFGDLEFKGLLDNKPTREDISIADADTTSSPAILNSNPFQKDDEKIPALLTALPDVYTLELDKMQDKFLLLACDGLWDVMTSEEAVEIFRDRWHYHSNLQLATKELAQEAIRRYSNDNITVIAVLLAPPH